MCARVGEAGDDFIALTDEFFDVIVEIWKRGADFAHVLFELSMPFTAVPIEPRKTMSAEMSSSRAVVLHAFQSSE